MFPLGAVAEVRLGRRLGRLQRDAAAVVADQRGLAVGRQPVAAAAAAVGAPPVVAADLAVPPALVVLRVQHGHLDQLVAATGWARRRQRRYPQAVRRVHADVRAGHGARVVHVVVVVVHLQVGRVVAPVNARVRAAGQRVLESPATPHPGRLLSAADAAVVQRRRRLGNLYGAKRLTKRL